MVIYEVNLTINNEIYQSYYAWLLEHITMMLKLSGFLKAELAKEKLTDAHSSDQTKLTVRYTVASEKDLNHYFEHHAKVMRDAGIKRFGEQFSAMRRILIEPVVMDLNP